MYWMDTTILGLLGLAALLGAWTGFVRQVARLIAFGAALLVSLSCNARVAPVLQTVLTDAPPWAGRLLAYVGVFCAVWVGFFLLALLLERGVKEAHMEWLNRLLGAAVGAAKAALCLGLVLLGASAYFQEASREAMAKSACASVLAQGARVVLTAVPAEYRDRLLEKLPPPDREGHAEAPAVAEGGS